jgi:hypothetical protein
MNAMVKIRPAHLILASAAVAGCVVEPPPDERGAARGGPPLADLDPRRSLAVTETAILERFGLERVLDQLVAQSGVASLTSLQLFRQWWDTQNPGPGLGLGPHCDDTVDALGKPSINGFPYTCRPAPGEGALAAADPFADPGLNPDELIPIGLFNRFDLAPFDGAHCGEHRIVYARRAGIATNTERVLVIFEMALTNPHPQQGLKGCRRIVEHWADLSDIDDLEERAERLEQLYFDGLPGVAPVVHVDHLGGGPLGAGQIRTNQFMQTGLTPRFWSLREFKLLRTCDAGGCSAMHVVPATVKGNPFGGLFRADSTHPATEAFRAALVAQVEVLAAPSLAELDVVVDDTFNTAQAQASGDENDYVTQLGVGDNPLRTALAARLAELGSTLAVEEIVARVQALSCAGCHRLSSGGAIGGGLVFPPSLGFVHVSERELEIVDGEPRFPISLALTDAFLPVREEVVEAYLDENLERGNRGPRDPIGGRRTH